MKLFKKLAAALLALTMVASMAACGSSGGSTAGSTAEAAKSDAPAAAASEAGSAPAAAAGDVDVNAAMSGKTIGYVTINGAAPWGRRHLQDPRRTDRHRKNRRVLPADDRRKR